MLTRIYGPERRENTRGWRKMYNEELHICNLYPLGVQVNENGLGGSCTTHTRRSSYETSVVKPEGWIPLDRTRRDGKMILSGS